MVRCEWLRAGAAGVEGLIAIIAALPREVAGLVKGCSPDRELRRSGVFLYRLPRGLVACAGMGGSRVLMALNAARAAGEVTTLVSTGLAGACDPTVQVAEVMEAGCVIDVQSGARIAGLPGGRTLVTTHSIASVREKQRLFASYGAAMVDMEAATVARVAQMHGMDFRAIKAVSDGHDFELNSLSRFASPRGHFRTGAFALHTALRPHRWGAAMQLGAGSQRALRALTETLKELVA